MDPVWSLAPWPVTFDHRGREYTIPALSAAEWLRVLMDPEAIIDNIFLELLPEPFDLIFDEDVDLEQLGHDVLSEVCGRPWYIAIRLIYLVQDNWNVLGADMLRRGIRPTDYSISGWLDVALLTLLHHVKREDQTMLMSQLEMPPSGEVQQVQDELEMTHEQFLALMR